MHRRLRSTGHLRWTNARPRHTSNEPTREETGQLCRQCIEEAIDGDAAPPFQSAQARGDDLLWRAPAAKRCRLSGDIEKGCLGCTGAKGEHAQAARAILLG